MKTSPIIHERDTQSRQNLSYYRKRLPQESNPYISITNDSRISNQSKLGINIKKENSIFHKFLTEKEYDHDEVIRPIAEKMTPKTQK